MHAAKDTTGSAARVSRHIRSERIHEEEMRVRKRRPTNEWVNAKRIEKISNCDFRTAAWPLARYNQIEEEMGEEKEGK